MDEDLPTHLLLASLHSNYPRPDPHPDLDVDQVREPKSFCTHCGAKLSPLPLSAPPLAEMSSCPRCKRMNRIPDRYCGTCGLRLIVPVAEPVITQG